MLLLRVYSKNFVLWIFTTKTFLPSTAFHRHISSHHNQYKRFIIGHCILFNSTNQFTYNISYSLIFVSLSVLQCFSSELSSKTDRWWKKQNAWGQLWRLGLRNWCVRARAGLLWLTHFLSFSLSLSRNTMNKALIILRQLFSLSHHAN